MRIQVYTSAVIMSLADQLQSITHLNVDLCIRMMLS